MGEFFGSIFKYITSNSISLSQKVAVSVVILFGLFIINNYFGFSYYYNTNNKIDVLSKLNSIMINPNSDSTVKSLAQKQLFSIANHNNFYESLLSFLGIHSEINATTPTISTVSAIDNIRSPNMLIRAINYFLVNNSTYGFFLIILFYRFNKYANKKVITISVVADMIVNSLLPIMFIIFGHEWLHVFISPGDTLWEIIKTALLFQLILISAYLGAEGGVYYLNNKVFKKEPPSK